jgi:[ribosomal protein S5]-alanine N-acetyltransferase
MTQLASAIEMPEDEPLAQPTLTTGRLVLRPFQMADAQPVQQLAGAVEVADTTLNIPHPYPDGAAEQWIAVLGEGFARGASATWAITLRDGGELVGAVGLVIRREHLHAELGYWIGMPYWGRGYATEAARAVLRYAFRGMELARVYASHFTRNPASGAVLRRIGMRHEGTFRQHYRKWGRMEDVDLYAMLVDELPADDDGSPPSG